MSVVIVETVCEDDNILTESLAVIARIFPAGENYLAGSSCVYLFAVNADKIKTVMCCAFVRL
jgi:hypothetical protein